MINPEKIVALEASAKLLHELLAEVIADSGLEKAKEGHEWALIKHLGFAAQGAHEAVSELHYAVRYAELLADKVAA